MLTTRNNNTKYCMVYTPDTSTPTAFDFNAVRPKKEPYIIFEFSCKSKAESHEVDNSNLRHCGVVKNTWGRIFIIVTSVRKVAKAIEIFIKLPIIDNNKSRYNHVIKNLINYKNKCLKIQAAKEKKILPKLSRPISDFNLFTADTYSNATNKVCRIVDRFDPTKEFIWKQYANVDRTISEIEAFNIACCRLWRGNLTPKAILIHDGKGNRNGIAIEKIPGLIKIAQKYSTNQLQLTEDLIINDDFYSIWLMAYIGQDPDLHTNNYGYNQNNQLRQFDKDRAAFSLTSKYIQIDPETGSEHYIPPPAAAFRITARDIDSFPILRDARLFHWLTTKNTSDLSGGHDEVLKHIPLKKLADNPVLCDRKYYLLLQRILISKIVYAHTADHFFRSKKMKLKHVNHQCDITHNLKNVLLRDPKFYDYLKRNPTDINRIIKEFQNNFLEFLDSATLVLSVNKVKYNFEVLIKNDIPIQQLRGYVSRREYERDQRDQCDYHPTFWGRFKLAIDAGTKISAAKKLIAIIEGKPLDEPLTSDNIAALNEGRLKNHVAACSHLIPEKIHAMINHKAISECRMML